MARILNGAGPYSIPDVEVLDGKAMQAARIASIQAESDADTQSSPRVKGMFDSSARAFGLVAVRPNNNRRVFAMHLL